MSDKPSLYVVEKKEVVILVVLFILVTVLSFTMGVRYGESVGKKSVHEKALADEEHNEEASEQVGGTLGEEKKDAEKAPAHEPSHGGHANHEDSKSGAKDPHASSHEAPAHQAENHGTSPEVAAKSNEKTHAASTPAKEVADKNSDEYLLNALKDAGVEPPGGKAPNEAKLPQEVKSVRSGSFVVQVGSHPTKSEADSQIKALRAKRVNAEVLAPFKDKQGDWHRVVIGGFKTKRDAEKEAKILKAKGAILSFFVWRMP